MASSREEIQATYMSERIRFDGGVAISNAKHAGEVVSLKGESEPGELVHGMTYTFFGRWGSYVNKRTKLSEKQFTFVSFVQTLAHDKEGIVAYLELHGKGNGVGRATALKAWNEWGPEAVRVIREDPRQLCKLNRGLTDSDLDGIQASLQAAQKTEHAMIELTDLLHGRGFMKSLPRKLIQEWGNRASEIVRRDPYSLMRFRGCGWKLCDRLYLELGHSPSRLKRQALCAWYSIASDSSGDVWHPLSKVEQAVRAAIGAKADTKRAIELATRLGRRSPNSHGALAAKKTIGIKGPLSDRGNYVWLAEGRHASHEQRLSECIVNAEQECKPAAVTEYSQVVELKPLDYVKCARCSRPLTAPEVHVWNGRPYGPTCIQSISDGTDVVVYPLHDWLAEHPQAEKIYHDLPSRIKFLPSFSLWPDPSDVRGITDHQRLALSNATAGRIGILGGSPGTGKTHTTAQLIRALLQSGRVSAEDIAVAAPTGKAAVRITEAMIAAKLPLRARTLHSHLGIAKNERNDGWGFEFGPSNPWPHKVIVIDEGSMPDLPITSATFAARARGTHLLLVGDINQLPPIGPGAPLRDLIAAGLPYGELREIMRASGGIVEACGAIRDGLPWGPGDNLHIIDPGSSDPEAWMRAAEEILAGCRAKGLDPIWSCQFLAMVNSKSGLSRKAINERFQGVLNPEGRVTDKTFRLNDKIVCLKNGYLTLADKESESSADPNLVRENQMYVANGQLGKVLEAEEKMLIVELDGMGCRVRVPRGKAEASSDDEDSDESNTGCAWDLAYGLTVHKYQGSECPVIIFFIDESAGAKRIACRELVYTGISRGKSEVYLIGRKSVADAYCRRQVLPSRRTFLRNEIEMLRTDQLLLEVA